jgi:hypothetical protein
MPCNNKNPKSKSDRYTCNPKTNRWVLVKRTGCNPKHPKMKSNRYICNPRTNRMILKTGAAAKKMGLAKTKTKTKTKTKETVMMRRRRMFVISS